MTSAAALVRIGGALLAAVLVAACASQRFDGRDGDRRFYEARCGVCHAPRPREEFGPAEWTRILDIMALRARLTPSERERVSSYLATR